jgi:flagellar protein FliS
MENYLHQKYKQESVLSMTNIEMLTALYDNAVKQLELTKIAFSKFDISEMNARLQHFQSIFRYLRTNLNYDYDIAKNLDQLYEYFISFAIQANIKKDITDIDEVINMIIDLRNTYIIAEKQLRVIS